MIIIIIIAQSKPSVSRTSYISLSKYICDELPLLLRESVRKSEIESSSVKSSSLSKNNAKTFTRTIIRIGSSVGKHPIVIAKFLEWIFIPVKIPLPLKAYGSSLAAKGLLGTPLVTSAFFFSSS